MQASFDFVDQNKRPVEEGEVLGIRNIVRSADDMCSSEYFAGGSPFTSAKSRSRPSLAPEPRGRYSQGSTRWASTSTLGGTISSLKDSRPIPSNARASAERLVRLARVRRWTPRSGMSPRGFWPLQVLPRRVQATSNRLPSAVPQSSSSVSAASSASLARWPVKSGKHVGGPETQPSAHGRVVRAGAGKEQRGLAATVRPHKDGHRVGEPHLEFSNPAKLADANEVQRVAPRGRVGPESVPDFLELLAIRDTTVAPPPRPSGSRSPSRPRPRRQP